jgi:hypothetical protein
MESTEIPAANAAATTPMSKEQRAQFDRDGYLVIPNALSAAEVDHYTDVIDRIYAEEQAADRLSAEGAMHTLSAVHRSPEVAPLLDHPTTFPLVWSILGWNVHVYHSHLDVHPQDHGAQALPLRVAPGRRPAEPRDRDRPAAAAVGQARLLALRRLAGGPGFSASCSASRCTRRRARRGR